jgi:hypothetical protein
MSPAIAGIAAARGLDSRSRLSFADGLRSPT